MQVPTHTGSFDQSFSLTIGGNNTPSSFPTTIPADLSAEITSQILAAFQRPPSLANTLHGKRRIHQGGRGRRTALFSSRKCGGAIPVESRLELAHSITLERSSHIADYRTQAIRMPLPGRRSAFPDFIVQNSAGKFEVHEVKPQIAHLTPNDIERFAIMKILLQASDIGFKLIDTSSLPTGMELERLLLQYTRGHFRAWTPTQIKAGLGLLSENSATSFAIAYDLLLRHGLPIQLADYLNFHGLWSEKAHGIVPSSLEAA